jgi:hypothetical protein
MHTPPGTAGALAVLVCALLTPSLVAHAAEERPAQTTASTHVKGFGEAVKRDAKAVGATCKEGAHRVAVAARGVAHEVATAAKRGAAETRAAFRGDRAATTPPT